MGDDSSQKRERWRTEVLVHVMSFLPVRNVFAVMSVSRDFETAAREAVKNRKCLVLGPGSFKAGSDDMNGLEVVFRHGSFPQVEEFERQLRMEKSVMMCTKLVELHVTCRLEFDDEPSPACTFSNWVVNALIEQNAETLEIVRLKGNYSMPLVTFPNLYELKVISVVANSLHLYPKLSSLKVISLKEETVTQLPVRLTYLSLDYMDICSSIIADGKSSLLAHLVNLRRIRFKVDHETNDDELLEFLLPFKLLERISISYADQADTHLFLQTIVNRHPNLVRLKLWNVKWNRDSVDALCRFRRLQHLSISIIGSDERSQWSADDVRLFLSSGSNATLKSVALPVKNKREAKEAADQVKRETGSQFEFTTRY